jgi:hypothetical protein
MTFRVAHRMLELGYWNHSARSGVIVRADMLGRIVAWDKGLISWIARKHDPSLTVPVDNAGAVAGAISKVAHYHS